MVSYSFDRMEENGASVCVLKYCAYDFKSKTGLYMSASVWQYGSAVFTNTRAPFIWSFSFSSHSYSLCSLLCCCNRYHFSQRTDSMQPINVCEILAEWKIWDYLKQKHILQRHKIELKYKSEATMFRCNTHIPTFNISSHNEQMLACFVSHSTDGLSEYHLCCRTNVLKGQMLFIIPSFSSIFSVVLSRRIH